MTTTRKRTVLDHHFGPWTIKKDSTEYPERTILEVAGGVTVEDDEINDATVLTFEGGGGAVLDAGDGVRVTSALGVYTVHGVRGTTAPEKHGAIGDGTTVDTTALAAALTAISGGTYGALVIGAKTYLSGTLTVPAGAALLGQGNKSVLKTTTNATLLDLGASADDVVVSNVKLLGNAAGTSQHAIAWGDAGTGPNRARFVGVTIDGFGGIGLRGSAQSGLTHMGPSFVGGYIINCYKGVQLADGGEYVVISGTHVRGCSDVGVAFSAGNLDLTGCNVSDNATGLRLVAGGNDAHGVISGCTINHNTIAVDCGAISNEQIISACKFYDGSWSVSGNTGLLHVVDSHIDCTSFTNANGNVLFENCTFSNAYAPGGVYSFTDTGTGVTEFRNCYDKTGRVPSFIAARQKQAYSFPSDANQTLSAQASIAQTLTISAGTITASRQLTSARAPAERREIRIVNNTAHTITFAWSTGTSASVPTNSWALISSDGTNAVILEAPGGAGSISVPGTGTELQARATASTLAAIPNTANNTTSVGFAIPLQLGALAGTYPPSGSIKVPASPNVIVGMDNGAAGTYAALSAGSATVALGGDAGAGNRFPTTRVIADTTIEARVGANVCSQWSASSVFLMPGGVTALRCDTTEMLASLPRKGNATPYASEGESTIANTGTYTLGASEYSNVCLEFSGGAIGTYTLPAPAAQKNAYLKFVRDTGGYARTLTIGSGTTYALPANGAAWVKVTPTGVFAVSGSGSAAPTGTGFRKIVSGVEQAAAEPVDLADATERTGTLPVGNGGTGLTAPPGTAAALLVNSGGSAYGASSNWRAASNQLYCDTNSKLAMPGSSIEVYNDGINGAWLTVGFPASSATTGDMRVQSGFVLVGRNQANNANANLIQWATANDLYVGAQSVIVNTRLWGTTTVGMACGANSDYVVTTAGAGTQFASGGATVLVVDGTSIQAGKPRHGLSTPYASEGQATINVTVNATRVLVAAEYSRAIWKFTSGGFSSTIQITVPAPANADASYTKDVRNMTGFDHFTFSTGAGNTMTIPAGRAGRIHVTPDGVTGFAYSDSTTASTVTGEV